jgi:hypothetical protein
MGEVIYGMLILIPWFQLPASPFTLTFNKTKLLGS